MIKCDLALLDLLARDEDSCGEICCCVECDKFEICNQRCTFIDEFETCDEAIDDGFNTYHLVETVIYNDGATRNELSTVESNIKPLNYESVFLDANVEYRYFDTKREALEYLGI